MHNKKTKKTFLAVFTVMALYVCSAHASNPGDACTVSGAVEQNGGQTLICNGSTWKETEQIDTAGKRLIQIDEDTGACNTDKDGRISYDATNDEWEYCDGSSWLPFEQAGCRGPAGCKNVGDVCTDGTIFAGCGGTDYHQMVTTRCDAGRTWNGSSCTGTATQFRWGDSSLNTNARATGVTEKSNGQANTIALTNGIENGTGDGKSTAGVQAHNAATYCANLSANGFGDTNPANGTVYTDWFLPATFELSIAFIFATQIGNLQADQFWSSSESSSTEAFYSNPSTLNSGTGPKNLNGYVRCFRLP